MMNALEKAITAALSALGENKTANDKAYLEFIKANFMIPIEKNQPEEAPRVLFLQETDLILLPAFTNRAYFDAWAAPIVDDIHLLTVSGVDLLKNIGEAVSVGLNIGSPSYKTFNPAEIARMKGMVMKFFTKN